MTVFNVIGVIYSLAAIIFALIKIPSTIRQLFKHPIATIRNVLLYFALFGVGLYAISALAATTPRARSEAIDQAVPFAVIAGLIVAATLAWRAWMARREQKYQIEQQMRDMPKPEGIAYPTSSNEVNEPVSEQGASKKENKGTVSSFDGSEA